MINIAYTHVSIVLGIFHYHMLQNKQSNSNSFYYMSIEIYVKYSAEIKFVFHCILYFSRRVVKHGLDWTCKTWTGLICKTWTGLIL